MRTRSSWIDISVPLYSGMVHWPDNPPVKIDRVMDMKRGSVCNVSNVSMGLHTGTHMDAPLHFIQDGVGLDQMPIDATVGPARVIAVRDPESVKPSDLGKIRRGERILFRTRNSISSWRTARFDRDFVYISKEAAECLAERGVRTVGVDYLSVGGYRKDGVETHRILLGAGIWIIEGLNLSRVKPGRYHLVCLPLKVIDADGAPARAILRHAR